MRRTLFLLLFAAVCYAAGAQAVFDRVLSGANRVLSSSGYGFVQTHLASFQRAALLYMREHADTLSAADASRLLDVQAYYLSEFSTRFLHDVFRKEGLSHEQRKELYYRFVKAATTHPLFCDPDTVTTRAFSNDRKTPARFSLDTDWEKAFREISGEQGEAAPPASVEDKQHNK